MRAPVRFGPILLALALTTGACAALLQVDDVTYGGDAGAESGGEDVAAGDAEDPQDVAVDTGRDAGDSGRTADADAAADADATRPCSDGAVEFPFCDDFDHFGLLQGWNQLMDGDASAALWPDHHVSPPNAARFAVTVGPSQDVRDVLIHTFTTPLVTRRVELDLNVFHDVAPRPFQQLLHIEFAQDVNGNAQFQVVILIDDKGSIVASLYNAVTAKNPAVSLNQTMPVKTATWQRLHVTIDFATKELLVTFDGLSGKGKLDDGADSGVPILSSSPRLSFGLANVLRTAADGGFARTSVAYDDLYFDAL